VNAYGSDPHLKRITRDLGAFTKNMDGVTYDIILKEEKTVSDGEQVEESLLELNREPSKHKIKISKSSIDKIGGHK
jgi:N-acetylglutamate synthase/N-acetylornithine aminotransferase